MNNEQKLFKNYFLAIFTFIKNNITLCITLVIIFSTSISLINIWVYLNHIGRLDLFPLSFQLKEFIQFIISPALIISILVTIITFFIHSLWIVISIHMGIPKDFLVGRCRASYLIIIPPIIIMMYFLSFIYMTFSPLLKNIIAANLCLASSFILYFFINIFRIPKTQNTNTKEPHIRLFLIFIFATILICVPFSLIFNFIDAKHVTYLNLFYILTVLFLSLVPAFIYLLICTKVNITGKKRNSFITSILLAIVYLVIFIYTCIFLIPNLFNYISFTSLQKIGMAETEQHTYLITSKNYSLEEFDTTTWHTIKTDTNKVYIKGINAFTLGETLLICPVSFIEESKTAFLLSFSSIMPTQDKEATYKFRQHNKQCIIFNKNEIKQWDSFKKEINKE